MTRPSPSPAPALLALLLASPAGAVMCLKPGSLGPDVPNCTAYQEGAAAKAAVGDNLVAISGEAAAESFDERAARDAAGPLLAGGASGKARAAAAKTAAAAAGLPASPSAAGADGPEVDRIAGEIVKGTGGSFQALEPAPKSAAALPAPTAVAPSGLTPAARAQSASAAAPPSPAGRAAPMAQGGSVSIGSLGGLSDSGRQAFDNSASGLSDDVTPAAPAAPARRAPTVRDCTALHPCADAN